MDVRNPMRGNLPAASGLSLRLPSPSGLATYTIRNTPLELPGTMGAFNRVAYAAAHVVVDPNARILRYDPAIAAWQKQEQENHAAAVAKAKG